MKCPRCKEEKQDVCFMWDCKIDEHQQYCVCVCGKCNKEMTDENYLSGKQTCNQYKRKERK